MYERINEWMEGIFINMIFYPSFDLDERIAYTKDKFSASFGASIYLLSMYYPFCYFFYALIQKY